MDHITTQRDAVKHFLTYISHIMGECVSGDTINPHVISNGFDVSQGEINSLMMSISRITCMRWGIVRVAPGMYGIQNHCEDWCCSRSKMSGDPIPMWFSGSHTLSCKGKFL
jgi:valyl-tRNA synthetase